jgi:hypothetical protein
LVLSCSASTHVVAELVSAIPIGVGTGRDFFLTFEPLYAAYFAVAVIRMVDEAQTPDR